MLLKIKKLLHTLNRPDGFLRCAASTQSAGGRPPTIDGDTIMATKSAGRTLLARHIEAALTGRQLTDGDSASSAPLFRPPASLRAPLTRSILCTSVALIALEPGIAAGVSLGELDVESRLGQPLNATVPIRIGAGESLTKACVTLPSAAGAELKNLPDYLYGVQLCVAPGNGLRGTGATLPMHAANRR